jgi:hypothetical protein
MITRVNFSAYSQSKPTKKREVDWDKVNQNFDRNQEKWQKIQKKHWLRNGLAQVPTLLRVPFNKAKDLIEDIKSGKYGNPHDSV